MKKFILFGLGLLALASGLRAGAQIYTVAPATLADWKIIGADRDKLQQGDVLVLPQGAELARTFPASPVIVSQTSVPHFGQDDTDWPVLQVGPASLVFLRQGKEGIVVLLVDEAISTLPVTVALDSEGRSAQPLEIVLGYDPVGHIGVVGFADQVVSFRSNANTGPVLVSLESGAKTSWAQNALEVLVLGSQGEPALTQAGDAGSARSGVLLRAATAKLQQRTETAVHGDPLINGILAPSVATPPGKRPGMEIFTPPAVRLDAKAVRLAVTKSIKPEGTR